MRPINPFDRRFTLDVQSNFDSTVNAIPTAKPNTVPAANLFQVSKGVPRTNTQTPIVPSSARTRQIVNGVENAHLNKSTKNPEELLFGLTSHTRNHFQ
jgi:hypothetical protein